MTMSSPDIWSAIAHRLTSIAQNPFSTYVWTSIAGIAIVIGAEIVVLGYARSSLKRILHPSRSTWTDIIWFSVRILGVGGLIVTVSSLGLSALAPRIAKHFFNFQLVLRIENPVLQFTASLVIFDFLSYWAHRGRHYFRWWWEFHKVHHSATEMNAITTSRGHPLDSAAIGIAIAIPIAIFGTTIYDPVLVAIVFSMHAALTHSMLPWRWGWFGRYVLYSPIGHRLHHSPLPEHCDKNFGAMLPIWDQIFGTYYSGDVLNDEVGVDDNYLNVRGFWLDMIEPVRLALRTVWGQRKPEAIPAGDTRQPG